MGDGKGFFVWKENGEINITFCNGYHDIKRHSAGNIQAAMLIIEKYVRGLRR